MPEARLVTKTVLLLLVLVVISAIAVVYSNHIARKRFSALESLRDESYQLDVEWSQLQLEHRALSSLGRVDNRAWEVLDMKQPTPDDMVIIQGE